MLTRAGSKFFMGCIAALLSASAFAYEIASRDSHSQPVLLSGDQVFSRSIGMLPYEPGLIYGRSSTLNLSDVKGSRPIPGMFPTAFIEYKNRPELIAVAMNVRADYSRQNPGYRNRRSDATDFDREKKQQEAKATNPDAPGSGPGIWAMLLLGFTFGCHQIRRKARTAGVRFTSL